MNTDKLTIIKTALQITIGLSEKAIQTPYFVGEDDAEDTPHINSGLALVDTGRIEDWPVARLCEWPTANYIAHTCNLGASMAKALLVCISNLEASTKTVSPLNNQRCKIIINSIINSFPDDI